MPEPSTLTASGEDRKLVVLPDVIDLRDRTYVPSLVPLHHETIPAVGELTIRDQHDEGSCTGFALAAVIDRQCRLGNRPGDVSTRMLFEMAKLHDDLPDETTRGSTLRGALKGFFHNGVCDEASAPYTLPPGSPPWELQVETARKAREVTLGAYFRLNHEINDYHTAINEAGAVLASGKIHSGWANPKNGEIKRSSRHEGRHAFAIVGYTQEGFVVQNSWGVHWGGFKGLKGVALWRYEDWFENVEDAWVMRLAVSAPSAFDVKFARNHSIFRDPKAAQEAFAPRRLDINGHYLHLDDGNFVTRGKYTQTMGSVEATAGLINKGTRGEEGAQAFKHILFFGHGALNNNTAIAKRVKAWRDVYKANGIYPMHIMWETGFNNEIVDVVQDLLFKTEERMGKGTEHLDARLEELAGPLGRKLWRDLKTTAKLTFDPKRDGGIALRKLLIAAQQNPKVKIHFASASAGVFLLAELADVMAELGIPLESVSLMAPACSVPHYNARIRPHLGKTIRKLNQYSLIDRREKSDTLNIYNKSLLCLVSNALEDNGERDLLGMETCIQEFGKPGLAALPKEHQVFFAGRDKDRTNSTAHRGFDRDLKTMNDILGTILGKRPKSSLSFSAAHLNGY